MHVEPEYAHVADEKEEFAYLNGQVQIRSLLRNWALDAKLSHKSSLWVAASQAAEKMSCFVILSPPEADRRSEGSAFSPIPRKKQTPRANRALGMTLLEFFRDLSSRDVRRLGKQGH
jgi:hypothetical protein